MAQTLTTLLVHIVYSTKEREPLIAAEIEPQLYGYIGAICTTHDSPMLAANGTRDHVHLLVSLSKKIALADLVMVVKKDSSKWLKAQGREFRGSGGRMDTPASRSEPRSAPPCPHTSHGRRRGTARSASRMSSEHS